MLQDKLEHRELDTKEVIVIAKELFFSVREINRRLDELRIIREHEECRGEIDLFIIERIKKLKETKFKLIFSLQDIRLPLIKALTFLSIYDEDRVTKDFEEIYMGAKDL